MRPWTRAFAAFTRKTEACAQRATPGWISREANISRLSIQTTLSSRRCSADAVAAAQRTGAQLVIYNYRLVTEEGVQDACLPMKDETLDIDQMGLANYFYRYWMPYVHGQEAWCRLYRRDIIEQNHLRYAPNDEIFAEDTLFSAMYLMHVHTLAALAKPYVNYLQRGDSLMGMIKPNLCRRLITLSVRLTDYVKACGRGKELADVLPVLCYDKLICKGIRLDPSLEDVYAAMTQMGQNATLRGLLHALLGVKPLAMYTLKTGKVFAHRRACGMFAARWLRGDVRGAAALVQGREEAGVKISVTSCRAIMRKGI